MALFPWSDSQQKAFEQAYKTALLWSENDGENSLDDITSEDHFSAEALTIINEDCALFVRSAGNLLSDIDPAAAGHDFWLTRNGHGVGFWDRQLGEIGDQLTAIAESYGYCNVEIGDDQQIYLSRQRPVPELSPFEPSEPSP